MTFALSFPPVDHIVNWPDFLFEGTAYGINKVVLVYFMAMVITIAFLGLGSKRQLIPTGVQNVAEMAVEFIDDIGEQTIGHGSRKWTPYLMSLFFFIFLTNIFEIIPVIQMPASARIALPMFLAVLTYLLFNVAGIRSLGLFGYLKANLFPPGVPAALYILVTPIEFVSNFLVKPFSLMVRLFANLLAGHILLVTFTVLSAGLVTSQWYVVFLPLPVFAVVFFTAFELLVSVLQAYVFTLLAGVYVGIAVSHEH